MRPPSTFFAAQKKVLFRSEGEVQDIGQRLDCLTPAGGACRTGEETTFLKSVDVIVGKILDADTNGNQVVIDHPRSASENRRFWE